MIGDKLKTSIMKINDLKNKNKEELIQIINKMIANSPNNKILLNHLLAGSKPNLNKTIKLIEKEIKDHTGSYRSAYQLYTLFIQSNPEEKDILTLSFEILPYFMEELDAFQDYPNDLATMTNHIFGVSCKYSVLFNQSKMIEELSSMLRKYDFSEYINQIFMDSFYTYMPEEILDQLLNE